MLPFNSGKTMLFRNPAIRISGYIDLVLSGQAVRLESVHPQCTRYMVVVTTNGRQDTEESVVLGMDFSPLDRSVCV